MKAPHILVVNARRKLYSPHCLRTSIHCVGWNSMGPTHPLLTEGEGRGNSTLSGFQICWSSPQALHSTFQPPLLLISAPYCAGPMGKLTLWRATSAIPNERRIYMIFLPPALGFVLPRKQPTKNVITFPTKSTRQKCSTNLESNWIF